MATFVYNKAAAEIFDGSIDLDTDTLKVMLVDDSYSPDRDDDVVDEGGAGDAESAEITATNYARAWGGAGRKTPSISVSEQDANDRAVAIIADLTWTALGGAVNDTVAGAILIKEGDANDTTSRLIAYFDIADTPTNGSDFILDFDAADGNIRIATA